MSLIFQRLAEGILWVGVYAGLVETSVSISFSLRNGLATSF